MRRAKDDRSYFFKEVPPMLNRIWAILFLALLAALPLNAAERSESVFDEEHKYERLLDSLTTLSLETQIKRLLGFIHAYPNNERAYLKLWERYQISKDFVSARNCFQLLAADTATRRNGYWLTAKLLARDTLETAQESAYDAFKQSLHLKSSPALIYDFVEFIYRTLNAEPIDTHDYLDAVFSSKDIALAALFYYYNGSQYERALVYAPQIPAEQKENLLVLFVLSECYFRAEKLDPSSRLLQAKNICKRGLMLTNSNKMREMRARMLAWRGEVAFAEDIYEHAQADYEAAYALALQIDDLYAQQKALAGLGKVQYMSSNYAQADSLYKKAIALGELADAHLDLSTLYSNSAHLLYENGKYSEALEQLRQGEAHARRARDEESLVSLQIASARVYRDLAIPHIGKQACMEAMTTAQKRGYVKLYHRAEGLYAQILVDEKDYNKARELCDKHIQYLHKTVNEFEIHNYTAIKADTYNETADYRRAIELYQEAIQQARKVSSWYYVAWYQLEIAQIDLKQNRFEEALFKFQAIFPDSLKEQNEALIQYYFNLGFVHQKRMDWHSAIAAYRKAAAIIAVTHERLNFDHFRIGYFSERARVFQGLAECYLQSYRERSRHGDLDSLWKYLQLTKGRSLTNMTTQTISKLNNKSHDSPASGYHESGKKLERLYRKWREGRAEYGAIKPKLEEARLEVIAQRLRLFEHHAMSAQRASATQSLTEAQTWLLQNNAAMLLYHTSEEAVFVFVLTNKQAYTILLPTTQRDLSHTIDFLLKPFHQFEGSDIEALPFHADLAHKLYQQLFAPITSAPGVVLPERLIIVPDGILTSLPFEILVTEPGQKKTYLPTEVPSYAKNFLLQRYSIVYCPNPGGISSSVNLPDQTSSALVFANPYSPSDGASWIFEALPHAGIEAERISKISSRTKLYTRQTATQQAFFREASQNNIIHFASHAFVDSSFYEFSALVLAPTDSTKDDGLLMGYEIERIKLNAALVTLSACKTGLGKIAEGEGVLGLPRLFLRAGAKSVLMTLWQVDDRFAAELVPRFYDYYLNDNLAKVDALARAKRSILQNNGSANGVYQQHPFYWAAFTLYGDPGQPQTSFQPNMRIFAVIAFIIIALALFGYQRFRVHKRARI